MKKNIIFDNINYVENIHRLQQQQTIHKKQQLDEKSLQQIQQLKFLTQRSCQLSIIQLLEICKLVNLKLTFQNYKCLDMYDNRLQRKSLNLINGIY
ncbi:unnamed protein product [Paramecium pentaurelia]|uniref:Uncharacterized protein n=1 Tax=Paramecium pentaurelia TaxID=43138 RepID=A0A8S1WN30_9CILI|nr:unnamed protein product [Paramecium pentaurelia]